jgi:mono/diheme cytochrome c family protein
MDGLRTDRKMGTVTQPFRIDCRAVALALAWAAIFSVRAIAQDKISPAKKASIEAQPIGSPAAIARGLTVYKDRCAICHFSESDARKIGPGLKGIYKRGKFTDGGKVEDASVENRVLNGGKDMPPFKPVLSAGQIRDLIAFLRTL